MFTQDQWASPRTHPDWGPRRLLDWLRPRHPRVHDWPATSTAGALLKREGLVAPRRRRRPTTHPGVVDPSTAEPNDLWTADFAGRFRTQDRVYCFPSRWRTCTAASSTRHGIPSVHGALARPVFERTFREYGLPRGMRTDNGAPFVTRGLCGLSALNVWWMRLGIPHQRIHPASPQENGAHYTPSPRQYPAKLPPLDYSGHFLVNRVTDAGTIRFQSRLLYFANALDNYAVGLEDVDDGIWSIHFGTVLLARFDERDYVIRE